MSISPPLVTVCARRSGPPSGHFRPLNHSISESARPYFSVTQHLVGLDAEATLPNELNVLDPRAPVNLRSMKKLLASLKTRPSVVLAHSEHLDSFGAWAELAKHFPSSLFAVNLMFGVSRNLNQMIAELTRFPRPENLVLLSESMELVDSLRRAGHDTASYFPEVDLIQKAETPNRKLVSSTNVFIPSGGWSSRGLPWTLTLISAIRKFRPLGFRPHFIVKLDDSYSGRPPVLKNVEFITQELNDNDLALVLDRTDIGIIPYSSEFRLKGSGFFNSFLIRRKIAFSRIGNAQAHRLGTLGLESMTLSNNARLAAQKFWYLQRSVAAREHLTRHVATALTDFGPSEQELSEFLAGLVRKWRLLNRCFRTP